MATVTDYHQCPACHTRIVWPVDTTGRKLPPANWGPDPAGTLAIQHTATGTWLGRVLASDERPVFPEKRFSRHQCQEGR